MVNFFRYLMRVINNYVKGVPMMEEENKPKKPRTPSEILQDKQQKKKPLEEGKDKFNKDGNLFIKLNTDDSALVVRADGTIEMISQDLENSDEGYVGDVEDLNKTFSLVLALTAALENEDLYNRIFHNLNMSLMKKWDQMPDDIKKEIVEKRNKIDNGRNTEEDIEKKKRVEEFRKRMNKYKESFLDDLDAEKERLKKDIQDEEEFHKRYGRQFGEVDDNWSFGGMDNQELPMDHLEAHRKPKMRKKKLNPLGGLRGVDWDPYDETLKSHGFDYRADEPPDEEEE